MKLPNIFASLMLRGMILSAFVQGSIFISPAQALSDDDFVYETPNNDSSIKAGTYYVLRDTRVYRLRKATEEDMDALDFGGDLSYTKFDYQNIKAGRKLKLASSNYGNVAYIVQNKLVKKYIDTKDVGTLAEYRAVLKQQEESREILKRWEELRSTAAPCPKRGTAYVLYDTVGFTYEHIAVEYLSITNDPEVRAAFAGKNQRYARVLHMAEKVSVVKWEPGKPWRVKVISSEGDTLYVSPKVLGSFPQK